MNKDSMASFIDGRTSVRKELHSWMVRSIDLVSLVSGLTLSISETIIKSIKGDYIGGAIYGRRSINLC